MRTTGLLTVRPRRSDDDDFIRALAQSAFARWSQAPGQSIMGMMDQRSARTLVAEKDGTKLGFSVVSFEILGRPFGPWARPAVAHLDAIAVEKSARGAGIGQVLLAGTETISRESGAVCLSLNTARSNRPAQRLFGAAGYQVTLEIREFYRNGQSALAMTKLLAD
jgi:ribosomal protein S18 acetylase RimI-like enzyme